jgi:hypothetical protein
MERAKAREARRTKTRRRKRQGRAKLFIATKSEYRPVLRKLNGKNVDGTEASQGKHGAQKQDASDAQWISSHAGWTRGKEKQHFLNVDRLSILKIVRGE